MFKCDQPALNQFSVQFLCFWSITDNIKEKHILFTMTPKLSFYLNYSWMYGF